MNIISNLGNQGQIEALNAIDCRLYHRNRRRSHHQQHGPRGAQDRDPVLSDVGAPDVCFWFSGNRMKAFVERGLFDDISDLFTREDLAAKLGGTATAVTVDGKQYGLPMGGILWGLFYRKDVFEANGWTPPATWADLLAFVEKAKGAGLTPITMGTKDLWPCGGFFDHLSLRQNGLDAHIALMDGKNPYTDASVVTLFDKWKELLDAGIFPADHAAYNWEPAGAALAQKRAAMMDLGGFVKYAFPPEEVEQIAYAPFPTMVEGMGKFEDFSVNSIHVPSNGANKEGARDFLAYFLQAGKPGQVPGARRRDPAAQRHAAVVRPMVNLAMAELPSIEGTAQYYDRDNRPRHGTGRHEGLPGVHGQPGSSRPDPRASGRRPRPHLRLRRPRPGAVLPGHPFPNTGVSHVRAVATASQLLLPALFLAPGAVLFAVVILAASVESVWISFFDWTVWVRKNGWGRGTMSSCGPIRSSGSA